MAPRPPPAAPRAPDPVAPDPTAYLATPLEPLRAATHAALMSGVTRTGARAAPQRPQPPLHALQTYIVRNNRTAYDRGESTVFAPPPALRAGDLFEQCTSVFRAKLVRDGSILGYVLREEGSGRELLKVHFHGDTSNAFSRAFKAFLRSPVLKWDVENYGLYEDLPIGANLGLIQEVFPDNRVFFPNEAMIGLPRLEMQVAAALGAKYYLAVTDVPEPVGEVDSAILGRFAPRSETYQMTLRNCTREEAVLWLTMVIATDMKRRKSQNTKYNTPFLFV